MECAGHVHGRRRSVTAPLPDVDFRSLFDAVVRLCLVVLPDAPRYTIVAVSDAYTRLTATKQEDMLGHGLFEAVANHPVDVDAGELGASLGQALSNRAPDVMAARRSKASGEHWWSPSNIPVVGSGGEVAYIIHVIDDVTEAHVSADRGRSLAQAQSLFDQAPASIFVADVDGNFREVNAAACKLLGYSRDELLGKSIMDIIPREDVARLAMTRDYLLSRGGVHTGDWTLLKQAGTAIPVEVSADILSDGRWQAFVQDISERKRLEAELRDANVFLDAIVENLPLMLFIKESTSLRFVRLNRAGETLLGWSRATLAGKSDFDLWDKDQAEFFVAKDRETLRVGNVVDIPEEPIQTRHQGIRILHTRKVPILDESGRARHLLGISEDVTERKQLEEEQRLLRDVSVALSGSLDYEQTLATMTQLAVQRVADWCAIDVIEDQQRMRRLKVASADPAGTALCAVLERMPPDRDLPHLSRFILEHGRSFVVAEVTREYVESMTQGLEHLEALLATGITSLIGVPLLHREKAIGVLMFGSSNHRRVYKPTDLRWADAMADRAAVAIENARLYRASIEALQARDQVLGVVAHDLRNPLSTILMQESVLRGRDGSAPELGVIYRAATRMNRLIQDLLDASLMEAGELRLQKARLSAKGLVVEGVESQMALAASSIELRVDTRCDNVDVWGDRERLLQVFENLIGNALKFTAAGGRITVGAASRDREVAFWVADSGCGIAPDAIPHLFERFWQASQHDRRGAGLGLPIVKGIVEAHGGHVWVESAIGRGSTFFFSIPMAVPT